MVYILEGTRVFVWEKKEDKDNFIEKYLARGDCSNISGRGKKGCTKVEGRGRLEEEGSGLFGAGWMRCRTVSGSSQQLVSVAMR